MRLISLLLFISLINLFAEGQISGSVPLPQEKKKSIPIGKYRGQISGKVSLPPPVIAAIWLESASLSAPANQPTFTLTQANYQFTQHLLVIPLGSSVSFPNTDPDYHNIFSLSKAKRFDLGRYKPKEKPIPKVTFDKLGFIKLRCEIHDHMKANIVVVDSPYFTTSDDSGQFSLKSIPAGNYTLHAQVDSKTSWQTSVTIENKKTSRIKF